MKKKVLVFIISLLILTSVIGLVMAATQQQTTATVSVNEYIDISITPCAGGGALSISYGDQDPGATNVKPVDCNDATDGDLKVTVEATTNTPVTVEISGTDYDGPDPSVIAIEQTEYAKDQAMTTPVTFTENPTTTTVWTSMGGAGSVAIDDLWFELDIPSSFLKAGAYPSTYTVDASKT